MIDRLLPGTLVGSYPQPNWLIDRAKLSKMVPRVLEKSLWRIPEPLLQEAHDDTTIVAISRLPATSHAHILRVETSDKLDFRLH